jgi:hypothetical protein
VHTALAGLKPRLSAQFTRHDGVQIAHLQRYTVRNGQAITAGPVHPFGMSVIVFSLPEALGPACAPMGRHIIPPLPRASGRRRLPPVDPAAVTITAVLAMHTGHIYSPRLPLQPAFGRFLLRAWAL